jgi:hypothetical protein
LGFAIVIDGSGNLKAWLFGFTNITYCHSYSPFLLYILHMDELLVLYMGSAAHADYILSRYAEA